jgi:hypothetical protein
MVKSNIIFDRNINKVVSSDKTRKRTKRLQIHQHRPISAFNDKEDEPTFDSRIFLAPKKRIGLMDFFKTRPKIVKKDLDVVRIDIDRPGVVESTEFKKKKKVSKLDRKKDEKYKKGKKKGLGLLPPDDPDDELKRLQLEEAREKKKERDDKKRKEEQEKTDELQKKQINIVIERDKKDKEDNDELKKKQIDSVNDEDDNMNVNLMKQNKKGRDNIKSLLVKESNPSIEEIEKNLMKEVESLPGSSDFKVEVESEDEKNIEEQQSNKYKNIIFDLHKSKKAPIKSTPKIFNKFFETSQGEKWRKYDYKNPKFESKQQMYTDIITDIEKIKPLKRRINIYENILNNFKTLNISDNTKKQIEDLLKKE